MALIVGGIAALALITASWLTYDILTGWCGYSTFIEETNPSGTIVARAKVQNCGATSDYYTFIELQKEGTKAETLWSTKGENKEMSINWATDGALEIKCPCSANLATQVTDGTAYGVRVRWIDTTGSSS